MADSFFVSDDGVWFRPTAHARGPWSPDACHAGPPTGLLARAMELAVPDKRLVRLTVELTAPIPFAGFEVTASVARAGRTVATLRGEIVSGDGTVCATAFGLAMAASGPMEVATVNETFGSVADASPLGFPISVTAHGLPAFNGDGVEVRYPPGESPAPGPTVAWMRTVPLLNDETPSPFQRMCPLADCGNAFGRNAEPWETTFVNTDITIVLHREPTTEWLGSSSVGRWENDGIGLADALLFDEQGVVGRALQTLLLRPAPSP